MTKYIRVDKGFQEILEKININFSLVEVRGDSVAHLFNGRMLLQQLLEKPIDEEEITTSRGDKKEE